MFKNKQWLQAIIQAIIAALTALLTAFSATSCIPELAPAL